MIAIVSGKSKDIAELCRRFSIRRLDLFGSAANGTFDPATSDIDFLVDLGEYEPHVADRFLDFADALEELLGRRVDLVTVPSVTNPYFQRAIDASRETVYEAGDGQAAA
jgi:predicted nucleotidyltransferase